MLEGEVCMPPGPVSMMPALLSSPVVGDSILMVRPCDLRLRFCTLVLALASLAASWCLSWWRWCGSVAYPGLALSWAWHQWSLELSTNFREGAW